MILDIPTLAVVGALVGGTLSAGLSLLAWILGEPKALRWWALSFWMGTIGAVFLSLRHQIPEGLSVLGANTFLPLARILMLAGVLLYVRRPMRGRWLTVFLVVYLALISWFEFVHPSIVARLSLFSAQATIWNAIIAWSLLRHGPPDVRASSLLAAAVFAGEAALDFVRPFIGASLSAGEDFMHGGAVVSASYLTSIVGALALFTALLLIVTHRLVIDLGREARTDQLTGLVNRRALLEEGTRALELCKRNALPCSLLLFDLDRFKAINDSYGHGGGDEVLRNFVRIVQGAGRRASDLFARYGVEEFVLVLPGVPPEGAAVVAERLCVAVASDPTHLAAKTVAATVSIGVAARGAAGSLEDLIARADHALYAAKAAGRNCVRVARLNPSMRGMR